MKLIILVHHKYKILDVLTHWNTFDSCSWRTCKNIVFLTWDAFRVLPIKCNLCKVKIYLRLSFKIEKPWNKEPNFVDSKQSCYYFHLVFGVQIPKTYPGVPNKFLIQ